MRYGRKVIEYKRLHQRVFHPAKSKTGVIMRGAMIRSSAAGQSNLLVGATHPDS